MRRVLSSAFAVIGLLVAPLAARAQQPREVTGRVTQAGTGAPLQDVTVGVVGQLVGARTNQNGEYRLRIATSGPVELMTRAIGFKRVTHKLAPEENTVNFALEKDVLLLEGVTVTGAATTVDREHATTAVSSVSSEELNRVPAVTIENALQGKVLGASINMNNGAPGGGAQITIRGASSLLGKIDPLIVVDNVIISNSTRSNGQRTITGSLNTAEENGTNRLADINPEDIESVEILKGSAASAIYGSQATNGVVVITTKRGRSGAPRFNFTQRVGTYQLIRNQGLRHFPNLHEALVDNYVACPEAVASSATPDPTKCGNPDGAKAAIAACTPSSCPYYDYYGEFYGRTDPSYETTASLSGGIESTKYYFSATNNYQAGIANNTGAKHQSFRANLDQAIGSRITVDVGGTMLRSFAQRGISNNDNTNSSPVYAFFTTPTIIDLRQKNADGSYIANPFAGGGPLRGSNPFQTFDLMRNNEDVYRMIGNANINYSAFSSATQNLRLTLLTGFDRLSSESYLFAPPSLQFEQPGTNNGTYPGAAVQGNGTQLLANTSINAVYGFDPSNHWFSSALSFGLQDERAQGNDYSITAQGLIPTQSNATNAQFTSASQSRSIRENQAYYVQEQVTALDDKLTLDAAVRGERSSVNGDPKKIYTFPRFGASYRIVNKIPFIDELKLRATRGQSGNQPSYGQRFITYSTAGLIDGQSGLVTSSTVGNPNIKPETVNETEGGADISFLHDRAHIEATWYNRDIKDLLVKPQIAPSTGVTNLQINGGTMRTRGSEFGLTLVPVETRGITWTSRTTFQQSKSKILSFPPGVNPFRLGAEGGFGYAYGTILYSPGYSATAIWGNIEGKGRGVVGDANPDYLMSFGNDVTYGAFSFSTLVDLRKGGDVSDLSLASFDDGGTTWDYDKIAPDGKTKMGVWRSQQWDGGNNTSAYILDGSYVKIREISVAWNVPQRLASHLSAAGVQNARLSLSGRNLFIISGYNGFDPEVNNGGNTVARFVDLAQWPPSRSFYLSLELGF